MKIRFFIALLLGLTLCGCLHSKKKVTETSQEESLEKRLFKVDYSKHSMYDAKPFNGTSTAKVRDYRTGNYEGSKDAPLKTFYSKTKEGIGSYGGVDKTASTSEAVLSQKSAVAGANLGYVSKDYHASQSYAGANVTPNVPAGAVPTRATSVPGAASKDSLTAEGQALNRKVQKGELTIEQVREILNKNR